MYIAYPLLRKINSYFIFEDILTEDILDVGTDNLITHFMDCIGIMPQYYMYEDIDYDKFIVNCKQNNIFKKYGEKIAVYIHISYTKAHGYKFILS